MVIYADVLMLVNFVVDYFLLSISCRFLHKKPRLIRLILSALAGGVFSLYIFLPKTYFLLQCAIQLLMCGVLCLIAVGYGNIKTFLRSVAVLFCVNFAYSGAMIALWLVAKPHGMVINNSVVYFNVSPLFLVLFSIIGYFLTAFLRRVLKNNFSKETHCTAVLYCEERTAWLRGIVDTGNSVVDVFGYSEIFITDSKTATPLLAEQKNNPARLRKIPCNTITGEKLLDGYRIDFAQVAFNGKKYEFKNPVLAVSQTPLDDCEIIVNPENLV